MYEKTYNYVLFLSLSFRFRCVDDWTWNWIKSVHTLNLNLSQFIIWTTIKSEHTHILNLIHNLNQNQMRSYKTWNLDMNTTWFATWNQFIQQFYLKSVHTSTSNQFTTTTDHTSYTYTMTHIIHIHIHQHLHWQRQPTPTSEPALFVVPIHLQPWRLFSSARGSAAALLPLLAHAGGE
jgi:hypothetical protein